jgi:hypothetical protein
MAHSADRAREPIPDVPLQDQPVRPPDATQPGWGLVGPVMGASGRHPDLLVAEGHLGHADTTLPTEEFGQPAVPPVWGSPRWGC